MSKRRRTSSSTSHQVPQALSQSVPLSSPGVLILSMTRQALYITPNAHKLLAELDGSRDASWDGATLPLAVQHVCKELQHNGNQYPRETESNKLYIRHLVRTTHATILVRGYGIFEQRGDQTGQFLILLERVPTESSAHDICGETECQFTARQRAIVKGLVLGHTNKQIAQSMLISVHTVKEYVRHLMMKMNTGSRAGIVARVAGLTFPSPNTSDHRKSQAAPDTIQVA